MATGGAGGTGAFGGVTIGLAGGCSGFAFVATAGIGGFGGLGISRATLAVVTSKEEREGDFSELISSGRVACF